jgi:hypothetical protein
MRGKERMNEGIGGDGDAIIIAEMSSGTYVGYY